MSDGSTLEISRAHVEGVDVVTVGGEVDLTNAEQVHAAVVETTAPTVVLDLTDVSYLDSSGIRELDRSHRLVAETERSFLIATPAESAAGWTLRIAGFDPSVILPTVDDAVSAAAGSRRS